MASLRQVTNLSRHFLAIGLICALILFVLFTTIQYIKNLHPTPPPPPTVAFGALPQIAFPTSATTQKLSYTLDTISGNLPDLGDRAGVYKIQQSTPILSALESAKTLVANMGYSSNPVKVSDTSYEWINSDDLPKTLLLNIYTNDFAISSPYQENSDVIQGNNLPDENGAIQTVMSFLQNANLLPTDIDTNKTKATLLSISGNQFVSSTSLSSTQVIQVDLFQQDVNKLPIFYPNPTHSTMSLFVAGGNNFPQIVLANFNHHIITQESATYPIISSKEALEAMQKGEGYIASFDGNASQVTIHNIVLGYYMSDKGQQYLEPIIVFEGDHGFYGYVPAVTGAWINK